MVRKIRTPRPPASPERQLAFQRGLSAEDRAVAFLSADGFQIVARRWRCPAGEIDIVARRGELLIFVEVKARARLDVAAYSVSEKQKRRIAAAAASWLAQHPDDAGCDMRFDAILVSPRAEPEHIPAAFEAE